MTALKDACELLSDLAERKAGLLHLHLTRAIERARDNEDGAEIALRVTIDTIRVALIQLRARDEPRHIAGDVLFNCAFYDPCALGNVIASLSVAQRDAVEWRRKTLAPIITLLCRGDSA